MFDFFALTPCFKLTIFDTIYELTRARGEYFLEYERLFWTFEPQLDRQTVAPIRNSNFKDYTHFLVNDARTM